MMTIMMMIMMIMIIIMDTTDESFCYDILAPLESDIKPKEQFKFIHARVN
jgi:hypothetical protein